MNPESIVANAAAAVVEEAKVVEQVVEHNMQSIYESLQHFLSKLGFRSHAAQEDGSYTADGNWAAEDQKAWQDACLVHGLPVHGTDTPHSKDAYDAFMAHPVVVSLTGATPAPAEPVVDEAAEQAERDRLAQEEADRAEAARLAAEAEARAAAEAEAARIAAEQAKADAAGKDTETPAADDKA